MLRALAIAARIAPGREHEGGRGRRLRSEEGVLIEDDEATIEELGRFDATAGVGAAAGAGRDLEPAGAEPGGAGPGHGARAAAAQEAPGAEPGGPPRGPGARGR